MIIDTHVHFSSEQFDNDREDAIKRAVQADVLKFIEVAFDVESSKEAVALAYCGKEIYASVGIHPHHAQEAEEENILDGLKVMAMDEKVVAWGEIGLDYYRDFSPKELQIKALYSQILCAAKAALPIILHCREAHEDMKKVLANYRQKDNFGVVHSFSGSVDDAKYYIEKGFLIGIGCPITYPKNYLLKRVVVEIPLDKIILETDSPYLPPQPFRGKRSEPAYLSYVVSEIASLRQIDKNEVEDITTRAAERLFNI